MREVGRTDRFGAFGGIKFYESFRHAKAHICLVTEALVSTDLFEKPTTPTTASIDGGSGMVAKCPRHILQLIHDLTLTLHLFHTRLDRLHGDLKPENIMFCRSTRQFKLIDYGSSCRTSESRYYEEGFEFGSWLYRAPEVFVGIPFGRGIDVWALGAILYEAITKRPLVRSIDRLEVLTGIADLLGPLPDTFSGGKFYESSLPLQSSFEETDAGWWRRWRCSSILGQTSIRDGQLLDLLARMLDPSPETRISVSEILAHPLLAPLVPFPPVDVAPLAPTAGESMDKENATSKSANGATSESMDEPIIGSKTVGRKKRGAAPKKETTANTTAPTAKRSR